MRELCSKEAPHEIGRRLDLIVMHLGSHGTHGPSPVLLGLVKHATFAERAWFDVALAGRTRAEIGLPKTVGDRFILTDDNTIESVLAQYRRTWTNADEIAAARHARHGDILREQILAAGDSPT